jgi:hypothetical protein
MTYPSPPEPNPGPARSTLGNVLFFFAVVALIAGLGLLGYMGERTASNAPAETTVGQSRPSSPAAK